MKTVYKYPFQVASEFSIAMPQGAEIVHVGTQMMGHQAQACLWAIVDPEQPIENRYFYLIGTGHAYEDPSNSYKHLGTFFLDGGAFVGHLFERKI